MKKVLDAVTDREWKGHLTRSQTPVRETGHWCAVLENERAIGALKWHLTWSLLKKERAIDTLSAGELNAGCWRTERALDAVSIQNKHGLTSSQLMYICLCKYRSYDQSWNYQVQLSKGKAPKASNLPSYCWGCGKSRFNSPLSSRLLRVLSRPPASYYDHFDIATLASKYWNIRASRVPTSSLWIT